MTTLIWSTVVFIAIGVPIGFVLAAAGLLFLATETPVPLTIVAQRLFSGLNEFTLMSIPLFILAGNLMNATGITERLIAFAALLMHRIYGGLAQANVVASMVFGGVSGVASADVAAIGTVMIPAMERHGYKREYATSVTLAGSLMGNLIPPSIPFVIYGVQAEQSIGSLFAAGIVPGVLIGFTLMALNVVLLKRAGFKNQPLVVAATPRVLARSFGSAIVAMVMPLVVIGGIVGGIFTPTEASGVAAFYALVVGGIVFRTLTVAKLMDVLRETARTSAVVMLIVVASSVLNYALAYSRIPTIATEGLLGLTTDPVVFTLIVMAILLIVGLPLDPVPGLIIMTPVLLAAATAYGIDPVHFGVIMVMTLALGLITPPVGASLFVAAAISGVSLGRMSRGVLPFLFGLLVLTVFIALFPDISMTLPRLIAPGRGAVP